MNEEYDEGEEFTDAGNSNGVYDEGEGFTDLDDDGIYNYAEELFDTNENSQSDACGEFEDNEYIVLAISDDP